ncbi:hypothetical protein [Streptomyces sp. NBC_01264]|uniref:hypothetical protein n=1 Tax=Streptomyces sp. NBC_01264 TaxID=2903804 RepID=UPI002253B217|nr:hypothetical protein [Streptomyces sp. NBC_01264]
MSTDTHPPAPGIRRRGREERAPASPFGTNQAASEDFRVGEAGRAEAIAAEGGLEPDIARLEGFCTDTEQNGLGIKLPDVGYTWVSE